MMMMMSKTTFGIAAAGAGLCFIGYCFYFDRKRRSDPLFKEKLRERRRKAKQQTKKPTSTSQIPDLKDTEAMQKFFMQEIQKGEELLAQGDVERGVEHLSNAVAVCGQPSQLLQVLQQTLPPQVFQLLIESVSLAPTRLAAASSQGPTVMTMDDLE
ncbi:mitochondrial import receptor subunit TOM20 homolog [Tubulanus polymorphus]|uniref:mitochondrial import receptor subunit TOM20 homolog n=1 Tax=Tubulanus polymorphus TaxID=672921 RepID=UPI003DA399C2